MNGITVSTSDTLELAITCVRSTVSVSKSMGTNAGKTVQAQRSLAQVQRTETAAPVTDPSSSPSGTSASDVHKTDSIRIPLDRAAPHRGTIVATAAHDRYVLGAF
ncbi:hypothetical protein D3C74_431060 [compost metagenome]